MTYMKFATATAIAALLVTPAAAQMYNGFDSNAGYDGFTTGFNEAGYHSAWDRDSDGMLSDREFGTGMYADRDSDRDGMLNNDEFSTGVYNTADLYVDQYISGEEEGWFDGDDIETEVKEVGDVW